MGNSSLIWHIVTGEYPPQPGGVSDYTFLVAHKLADAGDEVHVWTPEIKNGTQEKSNVTLHRLGGHFGWSALRQLHRALKSETRPCRLLVQYVPHMYGMKNMNVLFAFWLKSLRPIAPWVMFHEIAYPYIKGQPLKHRLLASVQHAMARWIAEGMECGFVSIPQFGETLARIAPRVKPAEWLPVPSTVSTRVDAERVKAIRRRIAPDANNRIIGHFGTYGGFIANDLLHEFSHAGAQDKNWHFMLLGRGSDAFEVRLLREHPGLKGRVFAAGPLEADEVASHLMAADVLYQPFEDGINSRRTSALAGLALGMPIVTTIGPATEPVWLDEKLVDAVPVGATQEIYSALVRGSAMGPQRDALMRRAREGYTAHFCIEKLIARLRQ